MSIAERTSNIVDALNAGLEPNVIANLADGYVLDIINMDTGDKNGNFMLTKALVNTLGSQYRKRLFSETATTGELRPLINKIIKPVTRKEHRMYETLSLLKYVEKVFGEGFVADIMFVVESYKGQIDEGLASWINVHFSGLSATKPSWVTFNESTDIKGSEECKRWKLGGSNNTYAKYSKLIEKARDDIEDLYVYYGDDDDRNVQAEEDDIVGEVDFIQDIMLDPKRNIGYTQAINGASVDPDRVFGPLNSFVEAECDGECILDGCRMLNCTCHEEFSDEEWFNGSCDVCDKLIRDKSFALRYPEENGGWRGCYCCLICLRKDNSMKQTRIDDMYDRLLYIGIMDRRQN